MNNKLTTFGEHLDKNRGKKGSASRAKYEADSLAFRLGLMLQEARKEAKLTQAQLAEKAGTNESYISEIETGKSNIELNMFYKIIELGLGKTLNISIG